MADSTKKSLQDRIDKKTPPFLSLIIANIIFQDRIYEKRK